ncbi:MAG: M48 family peptidase, partial [Kiritimatiellia bacterium]
MNPYLVTVLVLLVGFTLFHLWIHALNLRAMEAEIPAEFQGVYDAASYAKSQQYLRESTQVDLMTQTLKTAVLVAFILCGGFAWIHRTASSLTDSMVLQGLVFAGLLLGISTLWNLPFQIYDTFVLEEKYGFNKTTPAVFAMDQIKGLILAALLGAPL